MTSKLGPNDNVWGDRPPRSSCMYMCTKPAVGVVFIREAESFLGGGQSPWFVDGVYCKGHLEGRVEGLSESEWVSGYRHRRFS